nr:MAG TPA: hypothetical protein [Bacteriophage sp.]
MIILSGDKEIPLLARIIFNFDINSSSLYIYTSVVSAVANESIVVPFNKCYRPSPSEPEISSFRELKSVFPKLGLSYIISQNSFIKSSTGDIFFTSVKLFYIFKSGSLLFKT